MTRRHYSALGKLFFLAGFIVFPLMPLVMFLGLSFLQAGAVGVGLIVISFAFLTHGSRIGDQQ